MNEIVQNKPRSLKQQLDDIRTTTAHLINLMNRFTSDCPQDDLTLMQGVHTCGKTLLSLSNKLIKLYPHIEE